MPRTRPPYPEEFRREAVELVRREGRTVRDVAESLGVSQQSLRAWLKQTQLDPGERHDGLGSRCAPLRARCAGPRPGQYAHDPELGNQVIRSPPKSGRLKAWDNLALVQRPVEDVGVPAHDGLVLVANGDALESEAGASGRSWPPALGQSDRDLRGDPGRAARTLAGAGRGLDARVASRHAASPRFARPHAAGPTATRTPPSGHASSTGWATTVFFGRAPTRARPSPTTTSPAAASEVADFGACVVSDAGRRFRPGRRATRRARRSGGPPLAHDRGQVGLSYGSDRFQGVGPVLAAPVGRATGGRSQSRTRRRRPRRSGRPSSSPCRARSDRGKR